LHGAGDLGQTLRPRPDQAQLGRHPQPRSSVQVPHTFGDRQTLVTQRSHQVEEDETGRQAVLVPDVATDGVSERLLVTEDERPDTTRLEVEGGVRDPLEAGERMYV